MFYYLERFFDWHNYLIDFKLLHLVITTLTTIILIYSNAKYNLIEEIVNIKDSKEPCGSFRQAMIDKPLQQNGIDEPLELRVAGTIDKPIELRIASNYTGHIYKKPKMQYSIFNHLINPLAYLNQLKIWLYHVFTDITLDTNRLLLFLEQQGTKIYSNNIFASKNTHNQKNTVKRISYYIFGLKPQFSFSIGTNPPPNNVSYIQNTEKIPSNFRHLISDMNIGNVIRQFRKKKGLKQNELAEKSDISQTYLSQIENNRRFPENKVLQKISKNLSLPIELMFFLSLEKENIPEKKRRYFEILAEPLKEIINDLLTNDEDTQRLDKCVNVFAEKDMVPKPPNKTDMDNHRT